MMPTEAFERTYASHLQRFETSMEALLPSPQEKPEAIHQAMHYCMGAGGKRLRPVLLLAAADLYPIAADPLPAAVAIECLHTYSLVHDDLPSMDNSPLRRGQPSAHVRFNEATAVLTGDALLTEAFQLLSSHYESQPARCVALIQCLAQAADSRHLIGGQVVDTLSENTEISRETLEYIHLHKTADMMIASLLMGLHLTNAPPEAFPVMRRIGQSLGLAFQIIDDILDTTSSTEILGKTTGNDARQSKNTYVSLHGIEESRSRARKETTKAIQACSELPETDPAFLEALIRKLEFRIK